MKKIKFTCSSCDAKLRVPSHLAGVSAPCPKCGATITAPKDLDHVDEAPRQESSVIAKAESTTRAKAQTSKSRVVAGSLLPASGVVESKTEVNTLPAQSAPVARAQAPVRQEASPVLPDPSPPREESPQELPSPSLPEPTPQSLESISDPMDSEPEVIVTEELNLKAPDPQPISPRPEPSTPPILEEPTVAKEPAPVPETQPIRVIPKSESLPPRHEEEATSQDLPRLDVNLAEGVENTQGPSTPGILENPPTKVQLPQVGSQSEFSPEDFFIPEDPQESASEAMASLPDPLPAETRALDEAPDLSGFPFPESISEESPAIPEPTHAQRNIPDPGEWVAQEVQPVSSPTETLTDDLSIPEINGETHDDFPPIEESFLQAPLLEEVEGEDSPPPFHEDSQSEFLDPPHAPQENDPSDEASLHEGSFENLLTQSIESEASPTYEEPQTQSQVVSPDFPFSPPSAPASGSPALPERPEQMPARTDADVLDEMFGDSASSRKMKRSTIVMLSIIAAVIIIAIVFVVLIGKALGGFNPTVGEENPNPITPPPYSSIEDTTPRSASTDNREPNIDEAPAIIDPESRERVEPNRSGIAPTIADSSTTNPAFSPDRGNAPDRISPPNSENTVETGFTGESRIGREDPTLTFDPNRGTSSENGGSDVAASLTNPNTGGVTPGENGSTTPGVDPSRNYNPPAAFPAPDGSESSPLGKTHDLLDAFLRAPNWQAQIPYIFQGESLRPTIEEYYKKYPFTSFDRFSLQLFQMEEDPEMGGPYWVYLVSDSDADRGYPVIVRVENGNLVVDWEIYSEFQDQHFAKFLDGSIASPHTFRVVIERVSDYYGADRKDFSDLKDYLVYQINPPYGDLGEFSEYAFVKRGSEVAKRLEAVVGLGEDALAVIITLEQKRFDHGVTHEVVTDYVTEGWFR